MKPALKQLELYCEANGMHLSCSSRRSGHYALVKHDGEPAGSGSANRGVPCHRLSGYYKPEELLIWIKGYDAGKRD